MNHQEEESSLEGSPRIINTSNNKSDGLNKCPNCGSAEISFNMESGKLRCDYCNAEWSEENAVESFGLNTNIRELKGVHSGSGAQDITIDTDTVTIKCQGCAAEIVINIANATQARCHWCRQTLSLNQQIPNGAVPDAILPFSINRDKAVENIEEFVKKRQMFATKKFKEEFVAENVIGVFMPYLVVDGNYNANLEGEGEVLVRRYTVTVGSGDNKREETRYDADVYKVYRNFDVTVDDLITESSTDRADMSAKGKTNNIINAILPFDTKNAVTYNSNYMKGHSSEKRDMNISDANPRIHEKFKNISKYQAKSMIQKYDRGVRWESNSVEVHGTRWITVYLPVWLYSYYVDKGNGKSFTHYIAVNGRNGATMGSVPVNHLKLTGVSLLAGAAGFGTGIGILLSEVFN